MKNVWAIFIILAFIFLAFVLIIPLKYKEQIIGEKLIPVNETNQTQVFIYYKSSLDLTNVFISKEIIRTTIIRNLYVRFKKKVISEKEVELCSDIFSGKKCIEIPENCEVLVQYGEANFNGKLVCVSPKNPFERNCIKIKIVCYKKIKPVYQFNIGMGGDVTINLISNISGCYLQVNNNVYYYSPCNFNLEMFTDNLNIKIIPESEGIIKELTIERKLPEGKFIRDFYVPENGRYKIVVAVQSGSVEVSLDGFKIGDVKDVLVSIVNLNKGTHTLIIRPVGDFALLKYIKIEKI